MTDLDLDAIRARRKRYEETPYPNWQPTAFVQAVTDTAGDVPDLLARVVELEAEVDRLSIALQAEIGQATSLAGIVKGERARAAKLEADLEEALKRIERLKWAQIYLPSGRCRLCGGTEGNHGMFCKHYVGPLEHRWVHTRVNPTFGGIDYTCACGGWFRQGGMAGHGDGTLDSEPMCSNADLDWRGERPVAPEHSGG